MCVFVFVCPCTPWQCLLLHLPDSPKEGKTWKDAMSICSSFGSSLVAIEDEIEQGKYKKMQPSCWHKESHNFPFWLISSCAAFVTMLLQGSSVGVWIGLREGNSRWTSYSNWSPVEPRSYFTVRKLLTSQTNPQCRILETPQLVFCVNYVGFTVELVRFQFIYSIRMCTIMYVRYQIVVNV